MAGMFPNAVARPSRERLPANSASTIPAKSSLPAQPGQPGRPAHGQQHPPLPLSPRRLPSLAQGAQSWGAVQCRLCLEADVIPTPYSAVFPGGPQGRFSSSSRSWGTGNVSPSPMPTPQPNTHTSSTPILPGRVKKKKKKCSLARVMKQCGGGGTRTRRAQTQGLGPRGINNPRLPTPAPSASRPCAGANFKVSSRGRGRPERLARVWGGFLIPQSRAVCSTAVKGA